MQVLHVGVLSRQNQLFVIFFQLDMDKIKEKLLKVSEVLTAI